MRESAQSSAVQTGTVKPGAAQLGAVRTSAVVVTYNSRDELENCLTPMLAGGVEVIVVDNDSSDGTPEVVSERYAGAILIRNPAGNTGFAAGCNLGIAAASGDVVILVNPDCRLEPADSERLSRHLLADPAVGIAGPRILAEDGEPTNSAHRFETPASHLAQFAGARSLPAPIKRGIAKLLPGGGSFAANSAADGAHDVDWVSGACLAARRDLLVELGGLDQGYFMYMEDEELCLRSVESGRRNHYLPSATAVHSGGASSGRKDIVWPEFYRSILRFQATHAGPAYHLIPPVLVLRALAGMAIGAVRDLQRRLAGAGTERRTLAWWRILRISAGATRARARRSWTEQAGRPPLPNPLEGKQTRIGAVPSDSASVSETGQDRSPSAAERSPASPVGGS